MRLITLDRCQTGMKLGKPIYNENEKVLLAKGTELTDSLIKRLMLLNIYTVYIDDELSEGIEIVESIPKEIHLEAVSVITECLDTIAGPNLDASNIQGMIKTERAIRSFKKIFKDILSYLTENRTALNLLATTKAHSNHVYTHSLNVAIYSCQLAIENGLPLKKIEDIGMGAMLHDVGKMFISPEVLNKAGALTKDEYEYVKSHSELGFDLLRKIHEIPLTVAHCALQHHERVDGGGYPRGLREDQIHSYAKILSVADVFDAVTSHRVYRRALLPHKGIELLYSGNGTQFESKQIQLFKDCIAIYPEGLTVKLNNGTTGIVSKYNFNAVGRPIIRMIKDEEGNEIKPFEIDLSSVENLTLEIIEADELLF
ncbi:HD-GYP domain-containing protein [Neobacillus sp. PS3-40]|uniref:HD-GYP domain-containing protein n=1 Tax=Neobacillus sp. PS3-40 TaxID=3070679 RepID=UPI0027E06C9A|nr:HD-GYP domain-containing protein [Neobacillus sp. PS3-40]WML42989.1 HD-GYP domain-containing protein [Neobacillus sp. PS3-40]